MSRWYRYKPTITGLQKKEQVPTGVKKITQIKHSVTCMGFDNVRVVLMNIQVF